VLKLAKETIYTARPALEIETAGFEVLGALLGLFTGAVEAGAGHGRMTTRERMLLNCCRRSSSVTMATRCRSLHPPAADCRFCCRDDRFLRGGYVPQAEGLRPAGLTGPIVQRAARLSVAVSSG
jgi:hypothetical protein